MVLGQLDICMGGKMSLNLYLTLYTKIHLMGIVGLHVKAGVQNLEKKTEENLHNLGEGKDFLDRIQRAQSPKGKIDKLNCLKIKNSCSSKDTVFFKK